MRTKLLFFICALVPLVSAADQTTNKNQSVPANTSPTTAQTIQLRNLSATTSRFVPTLESLSTTECLRENIDYQLRGRNLGVQENQLLQLEQAGIHFELYIINWQDNNIQFRLALGMDQNSGNDFSLKLFNNQGQMLGNALTGLSICQRTSRPLPTSNLERNADLIVDKKITSTTTAPSAQTPSPQIPTRGAEQSNNPVTNPQTNNDTTQAPPATGGTLSNLPLPPAPQELALSSNEEEQWIPEEIVTVSADLQQAQALEQDLLAYGIRIKSRSVLGNLSLVSTVFRLPRGTKVSDILVQLRQAFPGQWIAGNQRYRLLGAAKYYALDLIGFSDSACPSQGRIGLIDSAIELQHPSLDSSRIEQKFFCDDTKADSHGTAIASILLGRAETQSTLLPKAHLYSAVAFSRTGKELQSSLEIMLNALDWLLEQQVRVINLSFGGERNPILELALQRVMDKGVLLVAAAGNNGKRATPSYPAAQQGVVAVTSVDSKDRIWKKASRGNYVDIAASGVDIYLADVNGKARYYSGSSFAAPLVSAALTQSPTTTTELEQWLQTHVVDLGKSGKDPEYGWGRLTWPVTCSTKE